MNEFWEVFYTTFAQIFDLYMYYPLKFPEPIGTITPFNITAFYFVANLLADMVNNIASRGGDNT